MLLDSRQAKIPSCFRFISAKRMLLLSHRPSAKSVFSTALIGKSQVFPSYKICFTNPTEANYSEKRFGVKCLFLHKILIKRVAKNVHITEEMLTTLEDNFLDGTGSQWKKLH